MMQKSLVLQEDDRYRNVSETRIADMALLAGWACERQSLEREQACNALHGWIEQGLPFRKASNRRLFDPIEVFNFAKQAGIEGRDDFWPNHMVRTARRLVEDLQAEGSRGFTVTLKRTFFVEPQQRLRLRMPLPLESDHLAGLAVVPFVDTEAQLTVTRGRLEARLTTADQASVTIGAEVSFAAGPRGADDTQPPDPVYLKPRDGMIVVSRRITDLADRLAGQGTATVQAVRAFWNFCLDELCLSATHYDQINWDAPGEWLLDSGWGDCQLVSALFCSLCRAWGIPARLMGGHFLYRPYATNHYWVEAWIDGEGWAPFDFWCWELSRGGQDSVWRDRFYGRLEPRLTTQCMPFDFTGATGVAQPAEWCILQWASEGGGVAVGMLDVNARPLYTDFVTVR